MSKSELPVILLLLFGLAICFVGMKVKSEAVQAVLCFLMLCVFLGLLTILFTS
ncbi:hypothetical protein GGR06_001637 [Bacteroides reticulotermitis]|uniref:Uncharacterized protein n=1 Tax=Bacteroides reticulotermitis TaxID=1133319 RepID=A0A840CYB2_9BACE|nr:hypothetical protein [Bacteroides reticulotermitis]